MYVYVCIHLAFNFILITKKAIKGGNLKVFYLVVHVYWLLLDYSIGVAILYN